MRVPVMSKYVKALLIKLLRFTVNFSLFIGLVYNEPFSHVLILIVILAPATYLIGDLFILPRFGGTVALLIDAPLIFSGVWAVHVWLGVSLGYGHYFLFSLITIALCVEEFIYHIYMERNVFGMDRPTLTEMINRL